MTDAPLSSAEALGVRYRRHRPEETLLYQIVERYYPRFEALRSVQDRPLPAFVQREFEAYLKCGCLEHGFLRVRCIDGGADKLVAFSCKLRGLCPSCGARRMIDTSALLVDEILPREPIRRWVLSVPIPLRLLFASQPAVMSSVLAIVIRAISGHLLAKSGYTRTQAQTDAVTLTQRFGSALNLNIHFHMLFLDGVYVGQPGPRLRFRRVGEPSAADLESLLEKISQRVARHLERRGLLMRDHENSYLAWDGESASPLDDVIGHAVTDRIAVGSHKGQKAFTLKTLPAMPAGDEEDHPKVVRAGTTHVIFEPLDFTARLAALVPRPRINLTRFHGVFAPHSRWRVQVTPARRGTRLCLGHRQPPTDPQDRLAQLSPETDPGGPANLRPGMARPLKWAQPFTILRPKPLATSPRPRPNPRRPAPKRQLLTTQQPLAYFAQGFCFSYSL